MQFQLTHNHFLAFLACRSRVGL